MAENLGVEIRSLRLKNNSKSIQELEITSKFEPVLSRMEEDISHPAFNNLFLKYDVMENSGSIIVNRNRRGNTNEIYLGTNLYTQGDKKGLEYETGTVTDPFVKLKRKIILKSEEEITLNLIISVSEDLDEIKRNLEYYRVQENVSKEFNIARAKAEEEARYLSLNQKDLLTFQKLVPYMVFQNPAKSVYLQNLPKKEYKQSDFWKYGISGDLPIILVLVKSINDVYIVKEMLKIHEYFRVKGIRTDLVILDYEKNIYEQYVKEQVIQEILNMQIGYLQNISGGIFLLNKNEIEDEDLFEMKANIVIPTNKANVYEAIEEMEEEYKDKIKNIENEKIAKIDVLEFEEIKPNVDFEKLKYFNSSGGFTEDGKEYVIKMNKNKKLPAPWSNVLTNEKFGTIVTSNMGGYTWSKNSRLNRISSWINMPDNDIPSEIIYLKDMMYNKKWTLNFSPMPDENNYYVFYGFGYAKYYHASLGIIQETEVFVPKNYGVKINIIRFKNTTAEKRRLKLIYYIKPVLRRR